MTASSDRVLVSYLEETSFKTIPASALQDIRYTSESFKQVTGTAMPSEIRGDRQVSDLKRTSISAEGSLGIEFSYGTFDDFLSSVIGSAAFDTGGSIGPAAFAVTIGPDQLTGTGIDVGVAVNDWVVLDNGAAALTNTLFKVTAVATGILTVSPAPVSADAGSGDEVLRFSSNAVNGVAKRSFMFEKHYQDLTTTFEAAYGQVPSTLSLTIATESIISGEIGFVGAYAITGSSTLGTGANTAATETDNMATVDEIAALFEGSDHADFLATEVTISVNGNPSTRMNLGENSPSSYGLGKFEITGSIKAHFASSDLIDKYLNGTETAMAIAVKDAAGNHTIFDFPRIKFTDGSRFSGGENSNVMAELTFTAYRDVSEDITMRISNIDA